MLAVKIFCGGLTDPWLRVCMVNIGDHMLHLGVFARASNPAKWNGGGKIEVVGLLSQTFPLFDDDRSTVRYPDCFNANDFPNSCPTGEAFWVDLPVHVGIGQVRIVPTDMKKRKGGEAVGGPLSCGSALRVAPSPWRAEATSSSPVVSSGTTWPQKAARSRPSLHAA